MSILKSFARVIGNASGIAYTTTRIVTDAVAAKTEDVLTKTNDKLAATRTSLQDLRTANRG